MDSVFGESSLVVVAAQLAEVAKQRSLQIEQLVVAAELLDGTFQLQKLLNLQHLPALFAAVAELLDESEIGLCFCLLPIAFFFGFSLLS